MKTSIDTIFADSIAAKQQFLHDNVDMMVEIMEKIRVAAGIDNDVDLTTADVVEEADAFDELNEAGTLDSTLDNAPKTRKTAKSKAEEVTVDK